MRKTPDMRSYIIISACLIIITLVAYWQVFEFNFVDYDDSDYVVKNLFVNTGLNTSNAAWAFTANVSANWHPLTWLSHMLDCQLYGLNPFGHHLTNLLLHISNTLLLFFLLSRMTGLPWRSGFVAALFAIHPLHIQSVAWIAERKDVLSTFFLLLTIFAYVRYTQKPNIKRYLLVLFTFALGLMSKPMLVTLPIILLLLDYWPLNRYDNLHNKQGISHITFFWKLVREKSPLLIMTIISCLITYNAQHAGGALSTLDSISIGIRIANALVAYIAYILKMLWPQGLCVLYPHPINHLPVWQVIASGLVFACITYLAIRSIRRLPYITIGWLWYVITLIPVIGLVQVGEQAIADRYTYIPLIGLFIAIAWLIPDLLEQHLKLTSRQNTLLALPAIILICILATSTWYQLKPWENAITLYERALRCTSNHTSVQKFLINKLVGRQRYEDAIALLTNAMKDGYNKAEAHDGIGLVLVRQGKIEEGISHYKIAMRLKPKMSEPHNNLGTAYARLKKFDQAAAELRKAIRYEPNYEEAHYNLAVVLSEQGKFKEAMTHYKKALKIKPTAIAYSKLGSLYLRQGDFDAGISNFRKAIRLNSYSLPAHMLLAIALYHKGDYEQSWREMHIAQKLGGEHPKFIADLSRKMPEPKE